MEKEAFWLNLDELPLHDPWLVLVQQNQILRALLKTPKSVGNFLFVLLLQTSDHLLQLL